MVVTRSQTKERQNEGKSLKSIKAYKAPNPKRQIPPMNSNRFGLIQEELQHNLYHLIVQAILWNQTRGKQAKPILDNILQRFPTPNQLSKANQNILSQILLPIGLYKQRAKRLIQLAKEWQSRPPHPDLLYKARSSTYQKGSDSQHPGWEIAHLPGVGPYALDSYRIFHRDQFLGLSGSWQGDPDKSDSFEPEWKRVLPLDKDLRAFLQWAWQREGYRWDPLTGQKVKLDLC